MNKILESWSTYLEAQQYAPGTVDLYRHYVEELFSFARTEDPAAVTVDVIEQWMLFHKDWSPTTRKVHYIAVKNFFSYLLNKKIIAEDPTVILPSVNVKRRIDESQDRGKEDRVYSPEQLLALIDYHDIRFKGQIARDSAIVALMAATGMRASEVAWLDVGQILHREGDTIFALRKGQNIRKIVVAEFAFHYIDAYLRQRGACKDDDPLFVTRCGNRITKNTIYEMLKVRQKAMNLRTGTHNIRYTVINAVERYANPVVARDIAGQKSISITNSYLVSNAEERGDAISNLPWAKKFFQKDI